MNKTKLLVGFLVITGISMVLISGAQLARADVHEGIGSMMGLAQDCSACRPGGVSCGGTIPSNCTKGGDPSVPPYQRMCAGACTIPCPWAAGIVCKYIGAPGSCDDFSVSCGEVKQDFCANWPSYCCCEPIPWTTVDCGDRNGCK
jgi:hypothetical protein